MQMNLMAVMILTLMIQILMIISFFFFKER
jgi:hypothetical protein